jgi:hypothetical protein
MKAWTPATPHFDDPHPRAGRAPRPRFQSRRASWMLTTALSLLGSSCASERSDEAAEADDAHAAAEPSDAPAAQVVAPQPAPLVDPSRNGPYRSTTLNNTGPGGGYTVYLPVDLGKSGEKAPIIGWMSGGGTMHNAYPLLPRLATHGFVVVAANVVPGIGTEVSLGKQIIAGIDWALAENQRAESTLFGKLDATKIASMGYSMGSLATFTIANDRRLTTTVHLSGGNFEPARVGNLHAPAAFICGVPAAACNILSATCDIAAVNCDTDFQNAKTPVFYANFQGGHLGTLIEPHASRIATLATNWLRYQLYDESARASAFVGSECTTCKDPNWKVRQKNLE